MTSFGEVTELTGRTIDLAGVLVIGAGAILAGARLAHERFAAGTLSYQRFRRELGHAILLGLEFLIAGDIIRTVVVAPTLENVVILGLVVMIRTFLSLGLKLEIDGRWPWQGERPLSPHDGA